MGNRTEYLRRAVEELKNAGLSIEAQSRFIETDPVGGPPQSPYLNGCLKVITNLPPLELLQILKAIERKLDRKETVRNGPRTVDIDILLYDRLTMKSPELTIPHPRMRDRNFVLIPLKDIAPELVKELTHAHRP